MARPRQTAVSAEEETKKEEASPAEETQPVEPTEAEAPAAEEEKVEAPSQEESVQVKGKFTLYRKGAEFIVKTNFGVLVSKGLSEEAGHKLLSDLNR